MVEVPAERAMQVLVAFVRRITEGDAGPSEILPRLAEAAIAEVGVAAAAVVDIGEEGRARLAVARGLPSGLDEVVERAGIPDEGMAETLLAATGDTFQRVVMLPLVSGGGLFGALVLFIDHREPLPRVSQYLAESLVDLAATALDKSFQTAELKQTLEELHASREALARAEKLRALGQMAAIVAHEVKNPLASLSGALQILGRRFAPSEVEHGIVERMLERLANLNTLVEDLLGIARPRVPKRTTVAVRSLFDSVLATFKGDPTHDQVMVKVHVEPEELSVYIDPAQFHGVLLNLLLNGAQAQDLRGRLVLRGRQEGDQVMISVADEGPGIPEGSRERIFEPFFTTKARGTGLGLPLVAQMVTAHEGTLEVECPPDGGSVFRIRLQS